MDADQHDCSVSAVAAAIAEPARTRMLCSLMDGHARTSTELAAIAEVSASTASAHLGRLKELDLVRLHVQGRHRYYSLSGQPVAQALEALMVISKSTAHHFIPNTPDRLQFARTCYDHMAGTLAVQLHDYFMESGWLAAQSSDAPEYVITEAGKHGFLALGLETGALSNQRRRFACACMDWSMRRPHLAGALGAAMLDLVLKRSWLRRDLDSRALTLTMGGRKEISRRLGVSLQSDTPTPLHMAG
ncbi:ArsR/SmtB family transcription factor [Pseudomonas asuensis]|uniref:Transcriptional regulator n=1 Tax=Pseudomonas asuensis TaxID=1825787 RepID=A0ABQ2H3T5_9PSED|nr:helix-turn-helix domain-containing protein [Pseudomonas asuensis]GGM29128.1 transcriptional regulator [Pseudomonas asuensis]